MLNLHRLRLLVELSRRGTVTDVAEAMSYSRSSVSQQLAQLQRETGVPLIEAVGRRVRLTTAGQILVRHAEQILRQVDLAEADLAATRSEVVGDLRVATFQTAAITMIPEMLTVMTERHPQLNIYLTEIQPDTSTAALLAGEFDLVLGELYPGLDQSPPTGIDRQPLFSDPLRLWVGKDSGRWTGHQLADFAAADWVFEPSGKPARTWAEAVCRAAGFEPHVRFESADLLCTPSWSRPGTPPPCCPTCSGAHALRRPAGSSCPVSHIAMSTLLSDRAPRPARPWSNCAAYSPNSPSTRRTTRVAHTCQIS